MANRLIHEASPYLRQHAHNPVDWYPWGPEALRRARDEDKPILLSIGYSACHWCHVMERESFENPAIAELMNENFVNIKVDREERPDLDSLYMAAVQALTQHGGWPMTVFLTPEGRPFYGGTYFPPSDRGGMPGFPRVLQSVAHAFKTRRAELETSARAISEHLSQQLPVGAPEGALSPETLDRAAAALAAAFDPRYGGFGGAPKFPQPMTLEFLLRHHARTGDERSLAMVEQTLQHMMRGGIYDHLGGGFHRYSTDREWLVPHFEKMLYDNAQLARLYLHAFQVTGNREYRRVVEETLAYVRREMTAPEGGFYSTQDADSEGEEGKFFLWTPEEVARVLGDEEARLFAAYYDVSSAGNFEGKSILNVRLPEDVVAREQGVTVERLREVRRNARARLFEARERRVKPGRDEKVLAAWNGLMLTAFAEAAAVVRDADYLRVAQDAAAFLRERMRRDRRLLRSWKDGEAKLNGYLEDYALVARGLLALHTAGGGAEWFVWARQLADDILAHFADSERGGFYDTSDDHEQLVSRPKDVTDNATPSGNSVAIEVFLMLAALTGEEQYRDAAERPLRSLSDLLAREPRFFGYALCAYDLATSDVPEVAIVGAPERLDTRALLAVCWERFRPDVVIAAGEPDSPGVPLLADRPLLGGRATAYVCRNFACHQPVNEPEALATQLDEAPVQFRDA